MGSMFMNQLYANYATLMSWDIGSFLQNSSNTLKKWGGYLIILIGVVMVVISAYQVFTGLASHGKKQTNWFVVVLLLIIGGAFMIGGFDFVSRIAEGGQKTIEDLGTGAGTILPYILW